MTRAVTRAAVLLALLPLAASAGAVEVTVDNVRAATGHVRVALCEAAQFTKLSGCPYHTNTASAAPSTVLRFDNVAPGTYAAQGYLDEHDWNEIRRDFFGRPKVGIGFSRDAKFRFGPPEFGDASFTVTADGVARVRMTLRYYD